MLRIDAVLFEMLPILFFFFFPKDTAIRRNICEKRIANVDNDMVLHMSMYTVDIY